MALVALSLATRHEPPWGTVPQRDPAAASRASLARRADRHARVALGTTSAARTGNMDFDSRMMGIDPVTYCFTGDGLRNVLEECGITESMMAEGINVSKEQVEAWIRDADGGIPKGADAYAKLLSMERSIFVGSIAQSLEETLDIDSTANGYTRVKKLLFPIINEDHWGNSREQWIVFHIYNMALKVIESIVTKKGVIVEYVDLDVNYRRSISDKNVNKEYIFMLKWVSKSFKLAAKQGLFEDEYAQKSHHAKQKHKKRLQRLRRRR
jgi:hypothetical protein